VMHQETLSAALPEIGLDTFLEGLWKQNPVFVHLMGMCPLLAVSNSVVNSLSMGLATLFVLVNSNIVVSLARRVIPNQVRIAAFIMIIATFVTVAEYILQAMSLEIHQALGAYVPLIVVNCIILSRAEAFASKNPLLPSILDGLGTGLGFLLAIFLMGAFRELLGAGSFLGFSLFGDNFEPWVVMILPSGGFFTLGVLMLGVYWINQRANRKPGDHPAAHAAQEAA
jgi:Na+-translocating ferredoxin:NAD+ oxidoreductase subunit E